MTYAPRALLDLRAYLRPITGLPDSALGITGDANHVGGYHHGWDQRAGSGDYSWVESPRDSGHRTNAASGFDLGMFSRLRDFSVWLVRECAANAADTRDIREVIYSPDGVTVKRWDRLGRRTSGDNSHRTHTHISFFRDAEGRDKTAVFRRFFGMEQNEALTAATNFDGRTVGDALGDLSNLRDALIGAGVVVPAAAGDWPKPGSPLDTLARLPELLEQITVPQPAPVDVAALVAALRPELEAAADRAVRKALGSLDEETPQP